MVKDPDPEPDSDPDPYLWLMDPDPGGQKHVDTVDPDPDHWEQGFRADFSFSLTFSKRLLLR